MMPEERQGTEIGGLSFPGQYLFDGSFEEIRRVRDGVVTLFAGNPTSSDLIHIYVKAYLEMCSLHDT